jgi:hypothetical protein
MSENITVKVKTWKEFRHLISKNNPESITFSIEKSIPAKNLTILRLILTIKKVQYVFLDSNKKDKLRKTGIPLHKNSFGILCIKEDDVINFVRAKTKKKNLKLYTYWSI